MLESLLLTVACGACRDSRDALAFGAGLATAAAAVAQSGTVAPPGSSKNSDKAATLTATGDLSTGTMTLGISSSDRSNPGAGDRTVTVPNVPPGQIRNDNR